MTFVGHSTVLVDLDGVRVLTDPLLGHVAAGTIRRVVPAVPPETLASLTAVFISHGHLDHLDFASLRALPGNPALIVPVGLGRVVARATRGVVHELRAGDRLTIGNLTLEAVHAEHPRRRSPFTTAEGALGVLITGSTSVYFAGDTDLFPAMEELAGRVDVALLPVSGWGPTLGRGHLDPRRAAEAAARIRPAIAMPIHWGTLWPLGLRRMAGLEGPGEAFRDAVAARAAGVDVRVLRPGGSMPLHQRPGR
ncbi:MAG: MBL fold metallo-hydrolase [Chloroflexi bacterium]|nr:MBL fold metallo-hydrolase [Chloroflexota bacterium]